MTVFLGTLWSSIKEVKAPFEFDVEHGILLHTMQWNRASSHGEEEVSWFFSSWGRNLGYILELRGDGPSKLVFLQRRLDSYIVARDTSAFSLRLDRAIRTPLEVRWETQSPFPIATVI